MKKNIHVLLCMLFSYISYPQEISKDSFKLYMCKKTQADKFIKNVLIIDSAAKDTTQAPQLLDSGFTHVKYGVKYNILIIGKKRWNYLIDFHSEDRYLISSMSFCFDRKAPHTRHRRQSNVDIRGVKLISTWSKKISKKTGKEVKCFGSKWYTSFRACWCK